jgi:phage baseplate assembly protein V
LVNLALKEQRIQVDLLAGETRDAEQYQHYGFTSVPISGAECIMVAVGGSRDHLVSVADGDRRYRPRNLAAGESALYNNTGMMLRMKADGSIEITGCTLLSCDGNVSDFVGTMQALRDVFNSHTHNGGAAPDQEMS